MQAAGRLPRAGRESREPVGSLARTQQKNPRTHWVAPSDPWKSPRTHWVADGDPVEKSANPLGRRPRPNRETRKPIGSVAAAQEKNPRTHWVVAGDPPGRSGQPNGSAAAIAPAAAGRLWVRGTTPPPAKPLLLRPLRHPPQGTTLSHREFLYRGIDGWRSLFVRLCCIVGAVCASLQTVAGDVDANPAEACSAGPGSSTVRKPLEEARKQ
jgi:hypothetical protein